MATAFRDDDDDLLEVRLRSRFTNLHHIVWMSAHELDRDQIVWARGTIYLREEGNTAPFGGGYVEVPARLIEYDRVLPEA